MPVTSASPCCPAGPSSCCPAWPAVLLAVSTAESLLSAYTDISFHCKQIWQGASVRNQDVLISGAGVAGQALAIWLRRFGFTPVVVERASAPRDGGQAVDLRGAAIEVARRTGILDAARAERTGTRGMSYVSSAGKRLASLDGAFGVIDPEDVEIVRGDLVSILYEAARNDVEFIFDDSISSLTDTTEGVTVTFERSAPRTFGLVAGADGLHSRVRG